jgi:hypothetical protein
MRLLPVSALKFVGWPSWHYSWQDINPLQSKLFLYIPTFWSKLIFQKMSNAQSLKAAAA